MVDVNEKIEDGEEDSDKKLIKESLCRIEKSLDKIQNEMVEGKEFSFHCVLSGLSMSVGLAVVGSSIAAGLAGIKNMFMEPLVSGISMIIGGVIVLFACFHHSECNNFL